MAKYDVCVYGHCYPGIEAKDADKAKQIATDEYYKHTGLKAFPSDKEVVWKKSSEYPYEWK